ncbi:MAG: UDP-glucose 4-epimerase [Dehalococcoidia bacterium]|nr:MAG: UDP-glucose 4-epimerase [Dehalococcoidia bacterium]
MPLASAKRPVLPVGSGRALVTGGAGFIGSHLVERLLADRWTVVVVDDFSTGQRSWLPDDDRLIVFEGDIRDAALIGRAIDGCSVVYHLAAVVGVRRVVADPLRAIQVIVDGTERVLEAALAARARVVLASSSEVYGLSDALPFAPDGPRLLGSTRVPRWAYATAKALDEHLLFAYRERGLEGVVLRYFNTYGPRQDAAGYAGVVATFCDAVVRGKPLEIHGDGRQTRCFLYVDDNVDATYRAGLVPEADGEILNLGSTEEVSILELGRLVAEAAGVPFDPRFVPYQDVFGDHFEDPPRRIPDIAASERVLGFRPTTPLHDGIARTLAWAAERHAAARS